MVESWVSRSEAFSWPCSRILSMTPLSPEDPTDSYRELQLKRFHWRLISTWVPALVLQGMKVPSEFPLVVHADLMDLFELLFIPVVLVPKNNIVSFQRFQVVL